MGPSSDFYPRSPCGERQWPDGLHRTEQNFYPRSPCGERRWLRCWQLAARDISIHALLAESDTWARGSRVTYVEFLSTLSLRRATLAGPSGPAFLYNFYPRSPCGERQQCVGIPVKCLLISIHALLAESDEQSASYNAYMEDFYPRSPCGERPL